MLVWNKVTRFLLLLGLYTAILAGSLYLAFQFRFDFYPSPYLDRFKLGLFLSLAITLPLLWFFGQFRSLLSYFGLPDAQKIVAATSLANLAMIGFWYGGWAELTPPRAIIILNFLLGTAGLIAVRLGFRLARERLIDPEPLIPFHEFRWGAWLRSRSLPPFSSLALEPALPAARALVRSHAASHLAGWTGGR